MRNESVQEFLARGGSITKCPVVESTEKEQNVKSVVAGPAVILQLDEAELLYGEKSTRKVKDKPINLDGIDLSVLDGDLLKSLGI